jgi:hypothetical protein
MNTTFGNNFKEMPMMSESIEQLTGTKLPSIPEIEVPRPFEYQTEKYKREGKIGEEVGATAFGFVFTETRRTSGFAVSGI